MKKTVLTISFSIILTILIISLVNVGLSIVLERPDYSDYCDNEYGLAKMDENITEETCVAEGGEWKNGFCDYYSECTKEYESALSSNNQTRYYVLAGFGFVLLLFGLFSKESMFQITGLATGTILVAEGVIMNFENKLIVFLSLLAMIVIFGIIAYRILHKN